MYDPSSFNHKQFTQTNNNILKQQTTLNINNNTLTHNNTHQLQNFQNQSQSISLIKDTIISLEYRIKTLEQQINSKMQRQQCLTLMQRKSNTNHVKKLIDQIYNKMENQRIKEQKEQEKKQQQQKKKINQLKKKLKDINQHQNKNSFDLGDPLLLTSPTNTLNNKKDDFASIQKVSNKLNKVLIKPQQLYLQSNQTMFSILIDQIKQLKQKDTLIQRLIESKHKKNISLNNQVCRKLQYLETSIEETIKYIDNWKDNITLATNLQQANELKRTKSKKQVNNIKGNGAEKEKEKSKQKVYSITSNYNDAFQSIRIELLSKSVEALQKQLSTKINIKDVLPIIKQNLTTYDDSIVQIRQYIEENFESTRKILSNQSQINQQFSNANKLAWWHLYQRQDNYLIFNKEMMNIIPQILVVQNSQPNNNITLKVMHQGWYFIKVCAVEQQTQENSQNSNRTPGNSIHIEMEINQNDRYSIINERLMNLASGTKLRFLADIQDVFLKIQKL